MSLLIYVASFFGGAFFANALPHLMVGISGRPLQTPFASPPFKGLSLEQAGPLPGFPSPRVERAG